MTSEELDEGRDVILENDDYIFMEILDSQAARYFGMEVIANTWERKFREGYLYFLIDKKFNGDSIWIHIPNMSVIEIETFNDEVLSLPDLLKRHSFLEKYIMDKVNPFNMGTYYALKAIAQGVPPLSDWTMQNVDDLISNFKHIKGNPRNSVVTLRFDSNDDYFKTFDVSEDTLWIFKILFNPYGNGYEFVDTYDNYQWKDGYILTYNLNDENKEKVNELLKFLKPRVFLTDNDGDNSKIAEILDDYYPEIGDDLMSEWASLENHARNEKAKEEVTEEFCNLYEKFNIFVKRGCFWEYVTPVWNLIRLYESKQMLNSDLYDLISAVGHTLSVTDYYEYIYEVYADKFDDEGFNREASRVLDKILEKIEEKDLDKVRKVYEEISKKFKLNKWYDFPADPNKQFIIKRVDLDSGMLEVRFMGDENLPYGFKKIEIQDFYNMIYNYSLF